LRRDGEDSSPDRSPDEVLYYSYDEKVRHVLLPSSNNIESIRFTRLAGAPSLVAGVDQRGRPVVEVVYSTHSERVIQRYVRHSPDGFEFGYGGSGPGDCALNVLALFVGVKNATERGLYHDFKFRFIAPLDQDEGGSVSAADVRTWIAEQWASSDKFREPIEGLRS